jgi:hypothetical protein
VDLEEVTEAASVDWGFMPLDIETYLLQWTTNKAHNNKQFLSVEDLCVV